MKIATKLRQRSGIRFEKKSPTGKNLSQKYDESPVRQILTFILRNMAEHLGEVYSLQDQLADARK